MAASDDTRRQIIRHLMGIPLFDRLAEDQVDRIFDICTVRKVAADEVLYAFGQPSHTLFILLDGQLAARTKAGIDIAYISPVGIVGEMGVVTDEPRSADVVALSEAMGFEIGKDALFSLFLSDADICMNVLLNLVGALSRKLYDTNAEIEKLRSEPAPPATRNIDDIFLY